MGFIEFSGLKFEITEVMYNLEITSIKATITSIECSPPIIIQVFLVGMKKDPQLVILGRNIRSLRVKKGYSQEEFAAHAGFSRSYYSGIERGEKNLSVLSLFKIARGLNINPKELISYG